MKDENIDELEKLVYEIIESSPKELKEQLTKIFESTQEFGFSLISKLVKIIEESEIE
jgi:hypothetical protein